MNNFHYPKLLFIGLAFILAACQPAGQPLNMAMLKPGDTIHSMGLGTCGQDAVSLWAFCSPAQYVGNTTTSNCRVPLIPRLAIGHILMPGDDALSRLDWSSIRWALAINDQPLDLKSFGTYDSVLPAMSHNASPVREVFVKFTAWDVVLTNLNPGEYKIHGLAKMGSESYSWVINLSIEGDDVGAGKSWAGNS